MGGGLFYLFIKIYLFIYFWLHGGLSYGIRGLLWLVGLVALQHVGSLAAKMVRKLPAMQET